MKTSEELYDEYFLDIFASSWDMWDEIDSECVRDLLDENNEKYSDDTIEDILNILLEDQKEYQEGVKESESRDLIDCIEDVIQCNVDHLENSDIGKILVKLANDYFEYD